MMVINSRIKPFILILVTVALSACFSTNRLLGKSDLDIKTKMSESIFLEPVSEDKKTVYVKIRNTSGKDSLNLDNVIKSSLMKEGYRISVNPNDATFILQANVLQAGQNEDEKKLLENLADAAVPGIIGGAIGKNTSGNTGAILGAAAGSSVGFIGSTLLKDTTYSVITDIQVKQKTIQSVKVAKITRDNAARKTKDNIDENGWRTFSTRVVSYANKVNLRYEDAEPKLVTALVNSIAGIF